MAKSQALVSAETRVLELEAQLKDVTIKLKSSIAQCNALRRVTTKAVPQSNPAVRAEAFSWLASQHPEQKSFSSAQVAEAIMHVATRH